MPKTRSLSAFALTAASALALAGCATPTGSTSTSAETEPAGDALLVVASTNVYGHIAEQLGGDAIEVTSIVTSAAQDPHSYEPSAQDTLAISNADLIVENGGGYDSFVDALIESSGSDAHVITAVEFSHDYPGAQEHSDEEHADEATAGDADAGAVAEEEHAHEEGEAHVEGEDHAHEEGEAHVEGEEGEAHAENGDHAHDHIEGFNEHVWYDPHTIAYVAEAIADELTELRPDDADTFATNLDAFTAEIEALEESLGDVADANGGARVFVTEPVPVYLAAEAGLENVTPDAFSEAVEEGQDVPPATLLESLDLLRADDVRVVITNTQTGGAETEQVIGEAETLRIPVIAFSETLPEGETYISWMQANIAALSDALAE
ncbi:zinc/manganese transport system substrate-binding protein [Microbacterium sp. SLBN-154]|uniref:metal ABC transporter substrate-binding protein n=1 Tax=Microbacterium sp. SLBN-154 TaxID=2768458 RepID=UPI00114D71B5|nr:zinc ABC transporter substrate-binding protein [Microbacterium sp. SLBN-154]TQK18149.1 zinc/manganese transport system substrate-binding protein [Microbacterium sp. SLBN-154]